MNLRITAVSTILAITFAVQALAADVYPWPVQYGTITSTIGWRINPFTHKGWTWHNGIDISVPIGTPVFAVSPGRIYYSGFWKGYGNLVVIYHGNAYFTLYGHNSHLYRRVGEWVQAGDVVALSGSTGRSTGPHVHFERRWWKNGPDLEQVDEVQKRKPVESYPERYQNPYKDVASIKDQE